MKFSLITYINHKKTREGHYSYEPYIREMNLWLESPYKVNIVAPEIISFPDGNDDKYIREDYNFKDIPKISFISFKDSMLSLVKIPEIMVVLFRTMWDSDHIHLRCPGNIGLLACIVQMVFPEKQKSAKYAGNWDPQAKQPWTYRLQKWILNNTFLTRNMQVLVYGEWPNPSKNIKSFFTASFSEKEIEGVRDKNFGGPSTFLFVGNLVEGKRPLEAVKLVEAVNAEVVQNRAPKIRASLEIFGDGPERLKLETYVRENQLEGFVTFKGNRPLEELKQAYQKAHFVILPSKSEGWPKAIAEGMFFGCIPIATPVSCVPWMLGGGSRGILLTEQANGQQLIANGSKEWSVVSGQDVVKIAQLLGDQEEMKRMSKQAKKWSQQYTLEKFEAAIQEVLQESNEKKIMENRKLSPAPFRGGVKRGKSEE